MRRCSTSTDLRETNLEILGNSQAVIIEGEPICVVAMSSKGFVM